MSVPAADFLEEEVEEYVLEGETYIICVLTYNGWFIQAGVDSLIRNKEELRKMLKEVSGSIWMKKIMRNNEDSNLFILDKNLLQRLLKKKNVHFYYIINSVANIEFLGST